MSALDPILLALNEPVFEADAKGAMRAATPALLDMLTLDAAHLPKLADAFVEADRAGIAQALKRVAEGKSASALVEARIAGTDGSDTAVEIKLVPIVEGKKTTGVYGWLRDISEQRNSERAATLQGTHLFNLVEHIGDACLIESDVGIVETLNAAFCELFGMGVASQSLIGIEVADVFAQARKSAKCDAGPALIESEGAALREFALGDRQIGQHTFSIFHEGDFLGRLYLFKTAGNPSALEQAQQTTAEQVELIEHIARELATTVESAGSAIHRAEQLDLPAQVIEHFQRVEISAHSAFTAIGGLLDFSRFEPSGIKTLTLDVQDFHLRESVASLMEHIAGPAEDHNLGLRVRIDQDVPDILTGDAPRLMLALRNLIEAMIVAVDSGGSEEPCEMRLEIAPEYAAEGTIHLSFGVEAVASGKAAKLWPHLPVSLMQIAMARQIISAMGGRLEDLRRKTASGFGFSLAFPARALSEPQTRPAFVTLTGMPVLIVNANPAHRHELATLTRTWRMHPHEADNATMALQLLLRMEREGKPLPLAIVSNELPVQDGFLLALRIKNHPRLKQTLVMMLAESGKHGDAMACRENGIIAYLRYPVSPDQLNEAIQAVTGINTGSDPEATHTLITRHSLRESRRATILLIDGDRDAQIAAGIQLRKGGYTLTVAEDAEQAIDALDQEVYDLVLVDPLTPGLEDAVKSLRGLSLQNADSIVIVAVSSDVSEKHRKKCEQAGFDGFVAKPFEKEALLKLLDAKLPEIEPAE